MVLPAEEPGPNGRGSDITKATYSQSVTKNNSTPSKPDTAVAVGEPRQQQSGGGGTPVELPRAASDGVEQKNGRATQKDSSNQTPPQQQSTREGAARQTQVSGWCGVCVCACVYISFSVVRISLDTAYIITVLVPVFAT